MSHIRITPLADQDLLEIWYFIAQDDPAAADRLLDLLRRNTDSLPIIRRWDQHDLISLKNSVITQWATICCCIALFPTGLSWFA